MFPISYRRHRFPPTLIQHAVWLYLRFTLSYRDVEELLACPASAPMRQIG
jgi:putative transposase